MPDTHDTEHRPAQDESPLGRIERDAPARVDAWLKIPREIIDDPDFPSGPVELTGLREHLMDGATPLPARDRVWRWLVERVRAERGLWYAAAVYLAIPGLRDRAWRMAPVPPHSLDDVDDAHAALILETLVAVHRVQINRRYIAARIIGQAAYHARGGRRPRFSATPVEDIEAVVYDAPQARKYPPTNTGNVDEALAELVGAHKDDPPGDTFDRIHAELIGRTYFETAANGGARTLGGGQYLSIRYTERLAEAGASVSVGSKGDSYDNALAETVNGLYKTELVHRHGPWRSLDDLELATLEYIDWFNHRRLHSACQHRPPAEYEAVYYDQRNALAAPARAQ